MNVSVYKHYLVDTDIKAKLIPLNLVNVNTLHNIDYLELTITKMEKRMVMRRGKTKLKQREAFVWETHGAQPPSHTSTS